ncbi:hypothetical protein SLEP1_g51508 [Rubroshorea leprosula]|uniref:Leucine-rich repeat-containing N-terminal plant-type domain-containing protein n=1 Tax=Rubroshorea leprosula TaxID=152421 RepID=A0AAV5M3E9_9ROSI|nr:hypothetical protein SLEP1_g51508 [Rubroshorea leprosula]
MRKTFCAMLVLVVVLFFGAAEFCSGRNTSFSCIEKERKALLKFKLCFHDPSHMLSSWKGNDCCEWRGVGCDKNNKYVVSLQLRGSIFSNQGPQLYLIDDVKEVGSSLLKLRYLEHLDLSNNNFSGNLISPSLSLMKQLRYLNLSYAQFRGRIPSELGNLTRLRVLDLSQYYYGGLKVDDDIQWISRLSSLQRLDMSGVNLSHASSNLFQVLGMLSSLSWLSLSDCSLKNSHLPSHNHLLNFTLLGNIQHFDMSQNSFYRPIPIFLQNMTSLTFLDMSGVNLSLTSSNLFQVLGMLPLLSWLDLSSCSLKNHHLPSCNHPINFTLLGNIQTLDLSVNFFQGPIPIFLQNMTSLIALYLFSNQLSGSISNSLGQLSKLKSIGLSNNQLNGSIPDSIGQLSKGGDPQPLFKDNNLTGRIPSCFGKFPIMVNATRLMYDLSDDFGDHALLMWVMHGRLFEYSWDQTPLMEVVKGRYLEYKRQPLRLEISIDLSSNNLIGSIPEELVFLKDLHNLNLSWNHFSGKIPEKIGQMENLESLDFSKNGLSGRIPNSMSSLTKLSHLNLSYNNLSGPIPTGYQLQTLEDPTIYAGNPQLCGAPLLNKCSNDTLPPTTTNFKDNDEGALKRMWFYIVMLLGFASGFWAVVGTLIFVKNWRYAYFQWVDDVQHWILVVITLKVAQFKKMFNGNQEY